MIHNKTLLIPELPFSRAQVRKQFSIDKVVITTSNFYIILETQNMTEINFEHIYLLQNMVNYQAIKYDEAIISLLTNNQNEFKI